MFAKTFYLFIQAFLAALSPMLSFIVSLRFYKNAISQFFIVVFAFYFGYFCHSFHDQSFHYLEFILYYVGNDFRDILENPMVFVHGHDYFHFLVKYVLSRFTTSQSVFGGTLCAIHVGMFIFFFRQLSAFYKQRLTQASGLILIIVCLVFEYWWYSTLRYNSATFFFAGFYLRYVNKNNWIYLGIALLAPLFHYSFVAIDGVVALELLFKYVFRHNIFRYGLLGFSLFVRTLNIDFVPFLAKHSGWVRDNMGYAVVNEDTRNSVLSLQQFMREEGNIVYNSRPYIMLLLGLFVLFLFKQWKLVFDKRYMPIFYIFLTIFSIANLGYGDMFFYDRLFQTSLLFLWTFVFISSVQHFGHTRRGNLLLCCLLILPCIYFFLTPIMQFRNSLMNSELLFGNFFMDWSGNDYDVGYSFYRTYR